MPRTLEERALSGSMGSEINENKEETSLHGGIIFRPLFVSAVEMIKEFEQQLPPYDARYK